MKLGVYLSKCGHHLATLEEYEDEFGLFFSIGCSNEAFPVNLTRLRREFKYLGEL
jgi:hypothetical protein